MAEILHAVTTEFPGTPDKEFLLQWAEWMDAHSTLLPPEDHDGWNVFLTLLEMSRVIPTGNMLNLIARDDMDQYARQLHVIAEKVSGGDYFKDVAGTSGYRRTMARYETPELRAEFDGAGRIAVESFETHEGVQVDVFSDEYDQS
jgi:hypothetical protein